ncbi:CsgG/HfaB family protein, partial [Escherichia coli]
QNTFSLHDALPISTAMLVTALKDSRWFIPLERQGLQNLLNERKIIRAAQENGTVAIRSEEHTSELQSPTTIWGGG